MVRNRFRILFFAALAPICILATAHADDTAVKKSIQAQYDKGAKAMRSEDAEGYAAICTPDATFLAPHKAPETIKELKSHIGPNPDPDSKVASVKMTLKKLKVSKAGDTAEADTESFMGGTMVDHEGQFGPKGKTHQWAAVSHTHDLWLKQKQGWRLKKSTIKAGSVFRLDGKAQPIQDETP